MLYFKRKHQLLLIVALLICAALSLSSILGCSGASTSMLNANSKPKEETTEADERVEGYDVCYSSTDEVGDCYYLIDLDTQHIKFFSSIPGLFWFEDDYEGDLDNGLYARVSDDVMVWIKYADSSKDAIEADYSYGESYTFGKTDVADAERLLDENGLLIGVGAGEALVDGAFSPEFIAQEAVGDATLDSVEIVERAEAPVVEPEQPLEPHEEPVMQEIVVHEAQPELEVAEPDPVPYQEPVIEEPVQYVAPVTYTFVLNKNTQKIHIASCRSVSQMKESNKLYVEGTREEVLSWYPNYTPCGNCHAMP